VRRESSREWRPSLVAAGGGSIVAAGTMLPWISLFAGLHSYAGIAGLYGRMMFAGGALAVAGGVAILVRPDPRLRLAIGSLGLALTIFAAWVLWGLRSTTHGLARHPLLLARPGPGLFVVLAGALLVAALLSPLPWRYDNAH
jgi:hypothetical protein